MLQHDSVCCSVLRFVTVCYSVLQCDTVCYGVCTTLTCVRFKEAVVKYQREFVSTQGSLSVLNATQAFIISSTVLGTMVCWCVWVCVGVC